MIPNLQVGMVETSYERLCFSREPVEALLQVSTGRFTHLQEYRLGELESNGNIQLSDGSSTPTIHEIGTPRRIANSSLSSSASPTFCRANSCSFDSQGLGYKRELASPSTSPAPRKRSRLPDRYSSRDVDHKDFFRPRTGSLVYGYSPKTPAPLSGLRCDKFSNDHYSPPPTMPHIGSRCSTDVSSVSAASGKFDFSKVPKGPKAIFRKPSLPSPPYAWPAVADDIKTSPYIFISSKDVPALQSTVKHLIRRLRKYYPQDIAVDIDGYYVTFEKSRHGAENAAKCYSECNMARLFGSYTMAMILHSGESFENVVSEPQPNGLRSPCLPRAAETSPINATLIPERPSRNLSIERPVNGLCHLIESCSAECQQSEPVPVRDTNSSTKADCEALCRGLIHRPAIDNMVRDNRNNELSISPYLQSRIRDDDEASLSSALTPSDISSANFKLREPRCHLCKTTHAPEYNPLVNCSSCRRQFHQACQKPPANPGQDEASWLCYYCLKRAKLKSRSLNNTEHTSSYPSMHEPPISSRSVERAPNNPIGNEMARHTPGALVETTVTPLLDEASSVIKDSGIGSKASIPEAVTARLTLPDHPNSPTISIPQDTGGPIASTEKSEIAINISSDHAGSELSDGSMIIDSPLTNSISEIVATSSTTSAAIHGLEIPDTPSPPQKAHGSDQSSPIGVLRDGSTGQRSLLTKCHNIEAASAERSYISSETLVRRNMPSLAACVFCTRAILKPPSGDKYTCVSCKTKRKLSIEPDSSITTIPETPKPPIISQNNSDRALTTISGSANSSTSNSIGTEQTELRAWFKGPLGFPKPKIISRVSKKMSQQIPEPTESSSCHTLSCTASLNQHLPISDVQQQGSVFPLLQDNDRAVSLSESSLSTPQTLTPVSGSFCVQLADRHSSETSRDEPGSEVTKGGTGSWNQICGGDNRSKTPEVCETGEVVPEPETLPCPPNHSPVASKEHFPKFSYRELIGLALLAGESHTLTATEINEWISGTYPSYALRVGKWESGISAVLSQHKDFIKLPRPGEKRCHWTFANNNTKKNYEVEVAKHTAILGPPISDKFTNLATSEASGAKDHNTIGTEDNISASAVRPTRRRFRVGGRPWERAIGEATSLQELQFDHDERDTIRQLDGNVNQAPPELVCDMETEYSPSDLTAGYQDSTDTQIPIFMSKPQEEDEVMEKDLFAAFPYYTLANVFFNKEERIREIKMRPSRKATFGKRLTFARTHRVNPHVELDSSRLSLANQFSGSSSEMAPNSQIMSPIKPIVGGLGSSQNVEILDGPNTTQEFSNIQELLGLPKDPIPITYENQLAFRERILINGRLPRPKLIYKVGRNVAGQLK